MKLLNTLIFAIFNLCLVLAIPAREQYFNNFNIWITGVGSGECDIVGLGPDYKNAKSINIPEYFTVENQKYYVRSIYPSAFSDSVFETVTFSSSKREVTINDRSFNDCKKLKKVFFYNENVVIDSNAFAGCRSDLTFDGPGVKAIVKKYAKELLKELKIDANQTGFDEAGTESREKKKKALYSLAKGIRSKIRTGGNSNLLAILHRRSASERGMHMLFRYLAILMGVDSNHILTVGDNHCAFWTYVKFDYDKWYDEWLNIDIYVYDFTKYDGKDGKGYPSDFFMKNGKFSDYLVGYVNHMFASDIHREPRKWVVYPSVYGMEYEGNPYERILIDDYIKQKNLGGDRV